MQACQRFDLSGRLFGTHILYICVSSICACLCGYKCTFVSGFCLQAVFSFMWYPPPICGDGYLIITTEKP